MARFQIGDTCRLTDRDEASKHTTTEMPKIVLYAGTDESFGTQRAELPQELRHLAADPEEDDFVRIFYCVPMRAKEYPNSFTTALVPIRLLEPAPHHFGNALRQAFFGQDSETKDYLAQQQRSRRRKKPL